MKKFFTPVFFRFLLGFFGMLTLGFSVISLVGFLNGETAAVGAPIEESSN